MIFKRRKIAQMTIIKIIEKFDWGKIIALCIFFFKIRPYPKIEFLFHKSKHISFLFFLENLQMHLNGIFKFCKHKRKKKGVGETKEL